MNLTELGSDINTILNKLDTLLPQVAGSAAEEDAWADKREAQAAYRIIFLAQHSRTAEAKRIRDRLSKYL